MRSAPTMAAVVLTLAGACTEVIEQPRAPVVPAAPAPPAATRKPERRPPPRSFGSWAGSDNAAAGAGPSAAAKAMREQAEAAEAEAKATMTLQRDKLQKVLDDALPSLTPCWGSESSLATNIAFEVTGAGKAENVRMPGAPAAAAKCVTEKLGALALPTYRGPVLSITIPVNVSTKVEHKPAAATGTSAPGAAAPAPAAPKLFVNP